MQTTHHALRVQGDLPGFERGATQLRALLDEHQVAGRPRFNVELVFEELVTNVIRHNYCEDAARHIDVSVAIGVDAIEMTIEDDGQPFDPLQRPDPARPKSVETATLGGLGIQLARKASKNVRYERTPDDKNRLTATIAR